MRLPSMQQLLHFTAPYYIANLLILASYIPMRLHWMQQGLSKYARAQNLEDIPQYEEQCAQAILFIVSAKLLWQRPTVDSFLADLFLYTKAALITVTFFADQRLCMFISLASLFVYIAAPKPYNDFVGNSKVESLTTESFAQVVTASSDVKWLVLFFTPNKHAHNLNADFAELSNQCSVEGQRFGTVNMATSPDVLAANAESYVWYQGSSLVMFQDGCEVCCLPDSESEVSASTLTLRNMKDKFGLKDVHTSSEAQGSVPNRADVKRRK